MTAARQALGRRGEELVARDLERRGWRILARNARVPGLRGELDIVADDGSALVVVEVKTCRAGARSGPESPLEQVGPRKRAKLRLLAAAWAAQAGAARRPGLALRIDVVGVRLDARGRPASWEHVRAAA